MTICWEHPEDKIEGWRGLNSAGMGHFRAHKLPSYIREGLQNSMDAKSESSGSEPVKVSINLIDVSVDSIPNVDQLRRNIRSALEFHKSEMKDEENKDSSAYLKPIQVYQKSLDLLSKKTIPVLQITDSNTTGMNWGNKKSHFFTYMKAEDHTSKGDEEGGSHGIGKMAPFVVSQLRTIFASSVYEIDGEFQQATMGKTLLSSLTDENNVQRVPIGFWGDNEGYKPVHTNTLKKSEWIYKSTSKSLSQSDVGTIISSLGFDQSENPSWNYEIASSILMNYFSAIFNKKLEVTVGKDIYLHANSLKVLFKKDDHFVNKMKKIKGNEAQYWERAFNTARNYASLLEEESEVRISSKTLPTLGKCKLRVKLGEKLEQKVCYIRNGMKITDDPKLERVNQFHGLMEFVALFECLDKKGNIILRSMENISHDSFDIDLIEDQKDKENARKAIREMTNWIRDELNNHAKRKGEDIKDVQELLEFFWTDEDDNGDESEDEINPFGKAVEIKLKPIKSPKLPKIINWEPAGRGGGGGGKVTTAESVPVSKFRFTKGENARELKLFFTPEFSGDAKITLFKSEADSSITKINIEKFLDDNEDIRFYEEGMRVQVDVRLESEFYGSLEINLSQDKGEFNEVS
jgi:hypothetical protein